MNETDRDRQRQRIEDNAATLLALAKWGGIPAVVMLLSIGGLFYQQQAEADDLKAAKADIRALQDAVADIKGDIKAIRMETSGTAQVLRDYFRGR